ncbi:MAG: hypothetical protein EB165_02725 [Euryarchaeota archaeon]|nr:hypothetical protein [Euryarchaeota archaeon]NDB93544.1 hypothetical protein [Euryarchaeota archaeon]
MSLILGFLSPVWLIVRTFLSTNGLMVAIAAGLMAVFWTYDSSRVQRGMEIERERTEAANKQAGEISSRVRVKSRTPSVRGNVDPYTLD